MSDDYIFTEWYLYIEGATPISVFNDKEAALTRLLAGAQTTSKEEEDVERYRKELLPSISKRLLITAADGKHPDRTVMRIYGPSGWRHKNAI